MSDPTAPMDRQAGSTRAPDPGRTADPGRPVAGPRPTDPGATPPVPPVDDPVMRPAAGPAVPAEGPADRHSVPRLKADVKAGADRAKHAAQEKVEDVKAEVDRTKEAVDRAKEDYKTAVEAKAGGPAEDPAQAETQVVDIRGSIERDLAALASRVPSGSDLQEKAKQVGVKVGAVVGGVVLVRTVLRRRGEKRRHESQVREQALAVARELRRMEREDTDHEVRRAAREQVERELRRQEAAREDTGAGAGTSESEDADGGGRPWGKLLLLAIGAGGAVVAARRAMEDGLDEDPFAVDGPPPAPLG